MYLKSISLRGFKSFGKKSYLEFEPGITVIVGPNGSGKSNIADAISWVLGEQSAKTLRGNSMEDVIFKSRNEEYGIAEVSLVFENKDKFLPLEFNEVKITRRVFQKGGSEYFINSAPARLTDILEMTSDRGVGKGLYTIINQGQIDEIALLKPIERKMIIDEIIGISKHKQRRAKSKIKLLKINSDIDRIKDLMHEIKRTMDPLEIESKKAQKYFETLNQLKNEELSLFILDINELNLKWGEENKRYSQLKIELEKINKKILDIENERDQYEKKFAETKQEFENFKNRIENFNNIKNKFESNKQLINNKKNTFYTLKNILNSQYLSLENSINQISNFKNQNFNLNIKNSNEFYTIENQKINEEFIKKVNQEINDIKSNLNKFYNKIRTFIKEEQSLVEINNDFNFILKKIDSLQVLFNSSLNKIKQDYKENDRFQNAIDDYENNKNANISKDSYIKNQINSLREEIIEKTENLKNLQKYCSKKIIQLEKLLNIILRFDKTIENLNSKMYSEFDEVLKQINNYNSITNQFLRNINDLKSQKHLAENEMYKIDLQKEQIKEKVKDLTNNILETYNLSIDFIVKNYKASEDRDKSIKIVKKLKNELKNFGTINPNATSDYQILNKRYKFLEEQQKDLIESKKKLEILIKEISEKVEQLFIQKFDQINTYFKTYFKLLFPLGQGELVLQNILQDGEKDFAVELKVDIGNSKIVPINLLSGGEKALVSIAFLFSVFAVNYSPFYVFDEIDASLDDMNLNRFVNLLKNFALGRQIIIITHQKKTMEIADSIFGVTMQSSGISKIVSERVQKINAGVN